MTKKIILGDCLQKISELSSASVDCVVTSPPYNIGAKYKFYNDKLSDEEYEKFTGKWLRGVFRILKPEGSLFLNVAGTRLKPSTPFDILNIAISKGFKLQNTIHWIKSMAMPQASGQELTRGHYKPVNSNKFLYNGHEYIFHLTPSGNSKLNKKAIGIPYADKSNIGRYGDEDLKDRGNVWFMPYKTIKNRNKDHPHPATFPDELPYRCFKLAGAKVGLDPFLGLGSSVIGARRAGLEHFIGIEIDPFYFDVAKKA